MKISCLECQTPMDVDISRINDAFIPPDLCTCDFCSPENEPAAFYVPQISYKTLREKEKEEISRHRWFMSERHGYDVGSEFAEADWRKNHEDDFLKQWNYR